MADDNRGPVFHFLFQTVYFFFSADLTAGKKFVLVSHQSSFVGANIVEEDKDNWDVLDHLNSKDNQMFDRYSSFFFQGAEVYTPVAIVCIIIGVCGNSLFYYYFGRKSTRVYKTRDGLYFRYLLIFDMLVCVIVLPYSILFELGSIKNNIVCKAMEFVRHSLTYLAHMFLVTYSGELTRRHNYMQEQDHLKRVVFVIVPLAVVAASPTLILYVADRSDHFLSELLVSNISHITNISQTTNVMSHVKSLNFSQPDELKNDTDNLETTIVTYRMRKNYDLDFCHLIFNMDTTKSSFTAIRILTTVYFAVNFAMFVIALLLFFNRLVNYLDSKPYLGRDSIFVNVYEKKNPYLANRVRAYSMSVLKNKKEKHRLKSRSTLTRSTEWKSTGDMFQKASKGGEKSSIEVDSHGLRPSGTDVDKIFSPVQFVLQSKEMKSNQTEFAVEDIVKPKPGDQLSNTMEPPSRSTNELQTKEDEANVPQAEQMGLGNTAVVPEPELEVPKDSLVSPQGAPNAEEPIRESQIEEDGSILRVTSYKKAVLAVIWLDIVIVILSSVLYKTIDLTSLLNMVHFKSVFTFYIVALINRNLRQSFWPQVCQQICCKGQTT